MRKSIWLLSASLAVFSTPAFAQDTTDQPSTPAEAPVEAASVDTAAQEAGRKYISVASYVLAGEK